MLHWQSVRPVPTVTIDFGDGRKLERTLTGNSIHYILDSQGRPIDALPGLYGPQAFLRADECRDVLQIADRQERSAKEFMLTMYYSQQHNKISAAWTIDTEKIGGKKPEGFRIVKGTNGEALSIAPLAVTGAY